MTSPPPSFCLGTVKHNIIPIFQPGYIVHTYIEGLKENIDIYIAVLENITARIPTEQRQRNLARKALLELELFFCISELVAVQVTETRKKIGRPTVPIFA